MKMKTYKAPDGYVYDWPEPKVDTIIDGDKIEKVEEHLYAKYLSIGRHDDIKNYKLVKDPRAGDNK